MLRKQERIIRTVRNKTEFLIIKIRRWKKSINKIECKLSGLWQGADVSGTSRNEWNAA